MSREAFERNTHALGRSTLTCPICRRPVTKVHIDTMLSRSLEDYRTDGPFTFAYRVAMSPCGHASDWQTTTLGGFHQPALDAAEPLGLPDGRTTCIGRDER